MDLGAESDFTQFPALIEMDKESYFLVQGKDGYMLLSTVCPHHGGESTAWISRGE